MANTGDGVTLWVRFWCSTRFTKSAARAGSCRTVSIIECKIRKGNIYFLSENCYLIKIKECQRKNRLLNTASITLKNEQLPHAFDTFCRLNQGGS